jgi:hypothetical protein
MRRRVKGEARFRKKQERAEKRAAAETPLVESNADFAYIAGHTEWASHMASPGLKLRLRMTYLLRTNYEKGICQSLS